MNVDSLGERDVLDPDRGHRERSAEPAARKEPAARQLEPTVSLIGAYYTVKRHHENRKPAALVCAAVDCNFICNYFVASRGI